MLWNDRRRSQDKLRVTGFKNGVARRAQRNRKHYIDVERTQGVPSCGGQDPRRQQGTGPPEQDSPAVRQAYEKVQGGKVEEVRLPGAPIVEWLEKEMEEGEFSAPRMMR